jgi:hypothetical protein
MFAAFAAEVVRFGQRWGRFMACGFSVGHADNNTVGRGILLVPINMLARRLEITRHGWLQPVFE